MSGPTCSRSFSSASRGEVKSARLTHPRSSQRHDARHRRGRTLIRPRPQLDLGQTGPPFAGVGRPAAFALWIAEVTGGRVPRFEKVERPRRMFWESRASVCTCCGGSRASQCSSSGLLTEGVYAAGVPGVEDFDYYVDERGIAEEHYPAAFALWIAEGYGRAGAAVREG